MGKKKKKTTQMTTESLKRMEMLCDSYEGAKEHEKLLVVWAREAGQTTVSLPIRSTPGF